MTDFEYDCIMEEINEYNNADFNTFGDLVDQYAINEKRRMNAERNMAYLQGTERERYAMDNGHEYIIYIDKHECLMYVYSKNDPYQDGNKSIWDVYRHQWIY